MTPSTMRTLFLVSILIVVSGCAAQADSDGFFRETGTLSSGDETLRTGEYVDRYTVSANPGQWIEVMMTSSSLDPYVMVQPPGCESTVAGDPCEGQSDNDDFDSADSRAYLWVQADQDGTWSALATSSSPGETGDYEIAYRVADAGEQPATPGIDVLADGANRSENGTLVSGDKTLDSGEFIDYYSFYGREGQSLSVDLRSSAFDPYLLLVMPGGDQLDNDDYEGDQSRSRIDTRLSADGMYRVGVTSYQPGESGAYELAISGAGTNAPADEASDPFTKQ